MTKYVVAWRYNDKDYEEEFEFLTIAELRLIKLEQYNMHATIHMKESIDESIITQSER